MSASQGRRARARDARKEAARRAVQRAVLNGALVRPDVCNECGEQKETEAHHEDYDRPLDVVWLCRGCHAAAHHGREGHEAPPENRGLCCPECGASVSEVVDTRHRGHGIARRRQCLACGARYSTRERLARRVMPQPDSFDALARRIAILLRSSGLLAHDTRDGAEGRSVVPDMVS